jgi:hypothetical protein
MAEAAVRMQAMRNRRRAMGLREIRLTVPDATNPAVIAETARHIAALQRHDERDVMELLETALALDADAAR